MKKLKENELSKAVKKFLRKKKLKPSDYQADVVEKTCSLLTKAFNKTYDVSNTALETVEEQLNKVHEAIFREEKLNAEKPQPKKARKRAAKKAVKKAARKATKKTTAKKATRKTARKAAKKAVKKAAVRKKVAKKAVARKSAVKKTTTRKRAARRAASGEA